MNSNENFVTFLYLSSTKLSIVVFNKFSQKKIYFKEVLNSDDTKIIKKELIDFFLEQNIFEIEKKIKSFVQNVNLIVKSDESLSTKISIKKNIYGKKLTKNMLIHLLNEAKEECKKTLNDKKIIHMVIENYYLDDINYSSFPENNNCNSFSLDINLISLSKSYINIMENILKKYQISVNRFLNFDYIEKFINKNQEDLFETSMKILNGYDQNEVLIVPKKTSIRGFFEKFFNFFD